MTTRFNDQVVWRKSSRSDDGNCVEVASTVGSILVRDSKDSAGPVLRFGLKQWRVFTQDVCRRGFSSVPAREQ
ncbi:DUF397 domain-containing protein [Micromonospora echinofusca]|uniref:DUF397 domain-containing protein n=1 Tax=Micromonospora echinofusca TaxID=47858 RepID=UPI00379E35C9